MKKLLIAAGVLASIASAQANPFSGPAVGVSLGVSNMKYKINQGLLGDTGFANIGKASGSGFNGRIFAQWTTIRGAFNFGVDLGVGGDATKAKKTVSGTAGALNLNYGSLMGNYSQFRGLTAASPFTVSTVLRNNLFLAPGIRFGGVVCGKTLLFGRVGVNVQFQRLDTTWATGTASATFKDNMVTTSVVPGVGVDYMVNDNMFVRAQVEYAFGVSVSGNRSSFKHKPNAFIANVGVGYQF